MFLCFFNLQITVFNIYGFNFSPVFDQITKRAQNFIIYEKGDSILMYICSPYTVLVIYSLSLIKLFFIYIILCTTIGYGVYMLADGHDLLFRHLCENDEQNAN